MSNSKFDEFKERHPEWSDEQIWAAISLEMEADKIIEQGGRDIDPNDPDMLQKIIVGARNWLREVLPSIFDKVAHAFETAIVTVGEWVQKGLSYAVDLIARLLGR